MLRKLMRFAPVVAVLGFVFIASGDVRGVISWLLLAYLIIRALPAVRGDFNYLLRRRLRMPVFRREGNNTL